MLNKLADNYWRTIIDTIQEGMMVVNPQGEITFVNKAFEKLLGYSAGELQGKSCEIFRCDRCYMTRSQGEEKYCALFNEEQVRSRECVFHRKDGSPVNLMKNAMVVKDDRGRVVAGVETLIDLSKVVANRKVIATLRQQLSSREGFKRIIGNSPKMRQIFDLATSAARSDAPLVIHGESGTGKELLAAAVHEISERAEGPFVKVNCAALSDSLLESELFGHVKGSFTGADRTRIGRFEAASTGSIFLDEVGDLSLATQTKLLRVLQEKEIERVGDHRPIKIDVRIIAATHKNLAKLIEEGSFREDLFYRINVIPLTLPPLRERLDDIPLLTDSFIARIRERTGKNIEGISREALDLLISRPWPGNVRELNNVIEYAFVLCPEGVIDAQHLPEPARPACGERTGSRRHPLPPAREDQRATLIEALEMAGGNQSQAARILGISRVTVWKRMKRYNISPGVFSE
ncbi:MAG: sigma 54-interacting transcriptional regulator [Desulfurivibrionaceae bacterium]